MFRKTLRLFCLLASLAILPASAASNPFIGTWQTQTMASGISLTIQIVFSPQGTYSELDNGLSPTAGHMMTKETGTYGMSAPSTLRLNVINWSPKQQCLAPSGCVPIRKPPGTTYHYKFTSATTFSAQDVTFGNGPTLTYHRIH
jgi:hypothetical protein